MYDAYLNHNPNPLPLLTIFRRGVQLIRQSVDPSDQVEVRVGIDIRCLSLLNRTAIVVVVVVVVVVVLMMIITTAVVVVVVVLMSDALIITSSSTTNSGWIIRGSQCEINRSGDS